MFCLWGFIIFCMVVFDGYELGYLLHFLFIDEPFIILLTLATALFITILTTLIIFLVIRYNTFKGVTLEINLQERKFFVRGEYGTMIFSPDDIDYWGIDKKYNKVLGFRLKKMRDDYVVGQIERRNRKIKFLPLMTFGESLCDFLLKNQNSLGMSQPEIIESNSDYYYFLDKGQRMRLSDY